jgi:DNA polymerase III subunit epsilon
MYAIVDIETTGGSPSTEKITEIAIYVHNGKEVVNEFCTLINPEKTIPYFITNLTGITNAMVADAPKFYEVARQIVEITQDKIFIAHNVSFDYHFIKNEFKRLGYNFARQQLCTVQLSRKLIPGLPSYSLGKLCKQLDIEINGRHRASGDAYATVKLFEQLLSLNNFSEQVEEQAAGFNRKGLHPNLDPVVIENLPEETGVYYLYNDKHDLIYIGKSRNIRNRVFSHFRNYKTKKAIDMRNATADIGFEITGSELIALLKESDEIKIHKPVYNRSQRRSTSHFGIHYFIDTNGYIQFKINKNSEKDESILCSFSTQKSAKVYMLQLIDTYNLCLKLCGSYPTTGACFHYEIAECKGACIGKEPAESYNQRARKVIDKHKFHHDSFFMLETGRSDDEVASVLIEKGKYIGYGYIDRNSEDSSLESLAACIHPFADNRDIQQILRNYLIQHSNIKIIPFQEEF